MWSKLFNNFYFFLSLSLFCVQQVQFQLDSTKQKDGQIVDFGLQIKQQQYELQVIVVLFHACTYFTV